MPLTRRRMLGASAAAAAGGGRASAQQPPDPLGRRLFADVRAYSQWPHHRTGTTEDRATITWFEQALQQRGAIVSRFDYTFPRYEWTARLSVGERAVEALPLWYEGIGEIATSEPFIRPVTLPNNFETGDVALALQEARQDEARLAILPTFGRFSSDEIRPALIGCNSDPDATPSGIPTLFVSGNELDSLAAGPVTALLSARRTSGQSQNVIGRFGIGDDPLVVATPLSGWFSCAGERGTGIAVALELATELSRQGPVVVIGSTGHELENYGIRQLLAAGLGFAPRAVLHVGASVAAGHRLADGRLQPSSTRFAVTSRPALQSYTTALRNAGFATFDRFLGEGATWSKAYPGLPLLSFAGTFRHFHTPADLPEASTTPALLERVYEAIRDAVTAVL